MARLVEVRNAGGSMLGWLFFCPGCKAIHRISYAFTVAGSVDRPTLSAGIRVRMKPHRNLGVRAEPAVVCSGLIVRGQIAFDRSCVHPLAGQTVPLPEASEWIWECEAGEPDLS